VIHPAAVEEAMGEQVSSVWYWVIGAAALVALVGLAVLEPSGAPAEKSSEIEVSGCVIGPDGRPVEKFEIVVVPQGGGEPRRMPFSDPGGRYTFTLAPGDYQVKCTAEGLGSVEEPLTVLPTAERVWLQLIVGR